MSNDKPVIPLRRMPATTEIQRKVIDYHDDPIVKATKLLPKNLSWAQFALLAAGIRTSGSPHAKKHFLIMWDHYLYQKGFLHDIGDGPTILEFDDDE